MGEAVIHIKSMGEMHSAMFYLNNFAYIRATYMIFVSLYVNSTATNTQSF